MLATRGVGRGQRAGTADPRVMSARAADATYAACLIAGMGMPGAGQPPQRHCGGRMTLAGLLDGGVEPGCEGAASGRHER
ncbi:hypothetical protein SSP24_80160 [Streptomyces spinoverrucosus]|uniref:Uncharacterized protein n=1 Tax=Streptomyces spinoverrucosus TaxID=284043 RepID=A0A4Y3VX59_9ACTN|nr:hypothetical protein SSP24_80160 [Streptomyces spinoverrucosus]GHB98491.1 hypothetical protein GCM10010397_83680 [Streptomyces spinoverrucosus]